jgi:hypothetical protein
VVEQARRGRIAPFDMTLDMQLNLLAPEIVDAILDGKQGTLFAPARLIVTPHPYGKSSGILSPDRRKRPVAVHCGEWSFAKESSQDHED